jgi:hypothetical protein
MRQDNGMIARCSFGLDAICCIFVASWRRTMYASLNVVYDHWIAILPLNPSACGACSAVATLQICFAGCIPIPEAVPCRISMQRRGPRSAYPSQC